MNQDINDNQPQNEEKSAEEIRDDIQQTRSEMSETIDALQDKLHPAHLQEQVKETVRDATVGKAQQVAQAVTGAVRRAGEAIGDATGGNASEDDVSADNTSLSRVNGTATAIDSTAGRTAHTGPLKPIREQVVVVFGASSGIGRETALQFAHRGARVVAAARSEEGLRTLVDEILREGGEAIAVVADTTEFDQVRAVAERAVAQYGRIDTWVHCAAVSIYATFEETTPEEFQRVIETNLLGQIYGAKAALPHLRREGRGALIHISSVEGKRAFPLQSAYSSSKHGMVGFLDALRLELQHEGVPIYVTNVMPAGINTPLFDKARTKMGVKPMPVPPVYDPTVVAEIILHAAEHPTREAVAGGAGRFMLLSQRLSPPMMDAVVSRAGFKGQQTDEPKSGDAPDNLFAPLNAYNTVRGDFNTKPSMTNWSNTHPIVWQTAKGVALAGVALWMVRKWKGR